MRRTILALALVAPACGRTPAEPGSPQGTSAVVTVEPAPSAPPADHLAPGELVEGNEEAFGLKLPREVHVERAQPGQIRVLGPVTIHSLVKYLRTRIADGNLTEGDTFATFDKVKLSGKPGMVFHFRLTGLPPQGTLLEMEDATPLPAVDLPDEAARWRKVGLSPQGKVLDPQHID